MRFINVLLTYLLTYRVRFLQIISPNQQCQSTEGSQLVFQIRAWSRSPSFLVPKLELDSVFLNLLTMESHIKTRNPHPCSPCTIIGEDMKMLKITACLATVKCRMACYSGLQMSHNTG